MKTFTIIGDDLSDGYHTFDELYEHRVALYIALVAETQWPSYFTAPSDGWFVLFLETPKGQISYHLPDKYLNDIFTFVTPAPDGYKWDGHTSANVLERLK